MWNLPPPPGFQGLRDDLPLTIYRRTLPHWRQNGATYFVTFRLADSLPQSRLRELRRFKEEWERRHRPPPTNEIDESLAREIMQRVEGWLDQGMGACLLKSPGHLSHLVRSLHLRDRSRYELGCYVVMPNHVHVVVRPLEPVTHPLENILKSWKASSACRINRELGISGQLWQHESFDRMIRDEEHLYRAVQYIGRNPELAGLSKEDVRLWISPTWIECGWDFED